MGEIALAEELAAGAHFQALQAYDLAEKQSGRLAMDAVEVAIYSRFCVGRMHYHRGDNVQAWEWFRLALRDSEAFEHRRMIALSLNWCSTLAWELEGGAGDRFRKFAAQRSEMVWVGEHSEERLWAFVHDIALRRLSVGGEPSFLWQASRSAEWYAGRGDGKHPIPWHAEDPLDRLVIFSSEALAAGFTSHANWFGRARRRWELTHYDKGDDEAFAITAIDVGKGAWELGEREIALDVWAQARQIAGARGEAVIVDRLDTLIQREK